MNNRYFHLDPIFRENTRHRSLNITENKSSLLGIYRLLLGTIDCKDEFTNEKFKFRENYFEIPYKKNTRVNKSLLLEPFPEEIKINDLDRFFALSRQNLSFYKSIEIELIKCLVAKEKSSYLEAFLYLYRIIEGISYTLPLIYTSKTNDYNKSYSLLQSYFNKSVDGELAFFKKFIIEVFKDEDFYKTTIDIHMSDLDFEELKPKYYELYKSKIPKPDQNIKNFIENEEINVSFIGFYEFIIEIRNRFFHFLQGTWKENLSSTEILYPDQFFKPLINNGLNWVGTIFFEILNYDYEKLPRD